MKIGQLHKGDIRWTGHQDGSRTLWEVPQTQSIYDRSQLVKVTVSSQSERGIIGSTAIVEYSDLKV